MTAERFKLLISNDVPTDASFASDPTAFRIAMQKYGRPKLGICISVMECIQARSPAHALFHMQKEREMEFHADVKYDGER